ncbi:MAG: hypothetical protein WAL29_06150 [Bacteroidales bacterium]
MKKITLLNAGLLLFAQVMLFLFLPACKNPIQVDDKRDGYNPIYWVEGAVERKEGDLNYEEARKITDDVYAKGWRGITYWGADRDGGEMIYYFNSPALKNQEWAVEGKDGLTPLVKAAHEKGIQVMINIEDVNPYHWEQNKWTPENIKSVVGDLAAAGVDAVFEECFEVKPDVFVSLARELKSRGVDYISGTDPMLLRESNFSTLWPETSIINIYNYYLKRDKIFNIATLTQHGSLGYGWARYWGKPTSLISPVNRNWGIAGDYSPAVISYLCMIRALQFRLDNFIIFGGYNTFDPVKTQKWINEYVEKQEINRPLFNLVVLLKKPTDYLSSETADPGWNRLFNSGDAITSGALNAGYDLIVSDKVVPADAYWIYTGGGNGDILPDEVIDLFSTGKPVFIQCGSGIPNGSLISPGWKAVLDKCGIDGTKRFGFGDGRESQLSVSLPPNQEEDIPYTGYYKDVYLRFTGSDVQRGIDLRSGTIIPKEAISGTVYCAPNKTYGRGPYIAGKDGKYVVTATSLNWEAAYPISDLLSGCGIKPSSNVWGIAGKNVTALLAIETTELEIKIPGLADGSKIHVVIWDNKSNKKSEETLTYAAPFRQILKEYDFILIDTVK